MNRMVFTMSKQVKQVSKVTLGGVEDTLFKSRRKVTEIQVDIEPSELFSDAAKYVLSSAERIFRSSINAPVVPVKVLEQYFFDALVQRVSVARSAKKQLTLQRRANYYPLPAIVYNAIRQVGIASDRAFGIQFVPSISVKTLNSNSCSKIKDDADEVVRYSQYQPLSDDDYEACINMFAAMEEEGYVVTGALSKEIYGDINFMAMTNVENKTAGPRAYRDTNPVYAFYRSFFYNQQLSQLCDTIYTYQYNDMAEMTSILRDICFGKSTLSGLSSVMSEFR